jgi:hypothetical protein
MTITSTQSIQPASVCNVAVGRYITDGTAAAITITVGFKARWIRVINQNASSSSFEWYEGMAAASALKRALAGDITVVTTNGITVAATTFIIGLDTDVNVTSEQLNWIAIG